MVFRRGGVTVTTDPSITVVVLGLVACASPTETTIPVGTVATWIVLARGYSSRDVVTVDPLESVAESRSSRWDG